MPKRLALLLGATALVGLSSLSTGIVHAQVVIDQNGAAAPDRGGGYDVDGDNGDDGHAIVDTNNADQLNVGASGYVGTANGGKGGNGGEGSIGTPLHTNGGEGGNGGHGGTVDITNNAHLSTNGDNHFGVAATAKGGNGGDGGSADAAATAESGDAGSGGAGGTASAKASSTSTIVTTGNRSYGIYSDASGGNGGQGGDFDVTVIGAGGNGGNGNSGGAASANNAGSVDTGGMFSYGMLVRSAGGTGGNGRGGPGIISNGGNGGAATNGGTVDGTNTSTGSIITRGDFASGMVVQSIGGGGGDGGGAFGLFGGGGAGAAGNNGNTATGTNDGTITTNGTGAIGMLVESVGGGGGDGGGAVGVVALGGRAGGGGTGGTVNANVGGTITTGDDGRGDGATGVLAQSVGGGGGNGGFAVSAGANIAVSIGGGGGTGGDGGIVNVNQAGSGATVHTHGSSAVGILAQSVGGGGGNGGGSISAGVFVSVGIGGSGGAAGAGQQVNYNIANVNVTTDGTDSAGIIAQSIGGGGGNGGFAIGAATLATIGVGGSGAAGGGANKVDMTTGGIVETKQDRSIGIIAQSIGGGGGNGGFTIGASLLATVGVGGTGSKGGDAGEVSFRTVDGGLQNITTHGFDSTGLVVQSIGGGGGNGGFSGAVGAVAAVAVGGSGAGGGDSKAVDATFNGTVDTSLDRSAGIIVQSVGGGGGNGGGVFTGSFAVSVGIGGDGGVGGATNTVKYTSDTTTITTGGNDSAGLIAQSVGGGGGNGGFSVNISAGVAVGIGGGSSKGSDGKRVDVDIGTATVTTTGDRSIGVLAQSVGGGGGSGGFTLAGSLAVSVGIGGKGAGGGNGGEVVATVRGGLISTSGEYSHAFVAQSIGGGGGAGGSTISAGLGVNVGVGGNGSVGGIGMNVTATNGAELKTDGIFSHGFLVQSVGGGGGSGGFSIAAGLGPAVSVAGSGDGGGSGGEVRATNTNNITTLQYGSMGLFAQSVGGGGGDGGFSYAVGTTAAVSVGGGGGKGGDGKLVDVENTANLIKTYGGLSHGILAQSVGGGGGNGGASNSVAVGLAAISVSIGGGGGGGGVGGDVIVNHTGDISVYGGGSKGIFAQSVGGNGGSGGDAFSLSAAANIYPYPAGALSVSVGGAGAAGGSGGTVEVTGNGHIASVANPDVLGSNNPDNGGGILAQSVGGRGGDGGRSRTYSGSFSPTVSINLGASIGGKGGGGGSGNTVTVKYGLNDPTSTIVTTGNNSNGILAQSIGGGGGNGGDSMAGAGGLGGTVTVNATVTVGGWGGSGNIGGTVIVTNAGKINTSGNTSNAILAQSIGGGGGSGGSASGTTASVSTGSNVNVNANVAIGGQGGDGNNGGAVTVTNSGILDTAGDFSNGILAQSIGGGGGAGGSADAKALNLGDSEGTTIDANLAIGGGGGDATGDRDHDGVTNQAEWATYALGLDSGSSGMKVIVDNSGNIHTHGYGSAGIVAQSVGGGGGVAGAATAGSQGKYGGSATVSVGAGIGLAGGDAGNGGEIQVSNSANIHTDLDESNGVTASSVGGGGGIGGAASSGVKADYAIGGSVGGLGGAAGIGGLVHVTNTATGEIRTLGNRSVGIFAQSIGGSGGAGGGGESHGSGATLTVNLVVGGFADGGGMGGNVIVENSGVITTGTLDPTTLARTGHGSHGIQAQSIGGGGGSGGAAGTTSEAADYQIAATLSGKGGKGGKGGDVTVTNNATGVITTAGDNADGIFAQSVGGGGGSAGAGNSQAKGGDTTVTLQLGGTGAGGANGGTVRVTNYGDITTLGVMSHGIFAQSIGGGGGASSSLTQASDGKTAIGIQLALADTIGPNKVVGAGADGGDVYVHHNAGTINTSGAGAFGIFAQSVGGGGGFGGSMTNASAGDGSYSLQVGVNGGFGGNGGNVEVLVAGDIHTTGALAHGVVAQSVGGGGGFGADASGKAQVSLGVGGLGGAGGNGGNVYVERTGTIVTEGTDSVAIIAQSVGGGGGIGGTSFGRFATSDDGDGPDGLTLEMLDGSKGVSGTVTVIQTGEIETFGLRSHGIVAQAVGGGGGIAGGLNKGAGSAGGVGDANAASATANSLIVIHGDESYAMFGQSATGQGNSNTVTLTAQDSLFAQGADSVAAYGESTASGVKGNIAINLNGQYTIGGAGTGVAAMLVGGADNTLTNHSLLYAMGATPTFEVQASQFQALKALLVAPGPDPVVPTNAILESLLDDFSPFAITGTSGDDHVDNSPLGGTLGRVIGNIDLGGGNNSFHNFADASMVGLKTIDLGGGLFTNDGLYTNQGIGVVATVNVGGGFKQDSTGSFVTDVDLNNQITDAVALTGAGNFNGEAPLNFLSIDKLFTTYVVANGSAMTDSGITATTLHPAAGFNFVFKVENGTDLVLTTDNQTFLQLAQDPQAGVNDPGVYQMAQYLDDVEASSSPDNPMARLINLLRFLPSEAEIGAALTRLTPHYAVHTFDMINREAETMLDTARECTGPASKNQDGRCIWATITPQGEYSRDAGAGTTSRDDTEKTMSLGGIGEIGQNWSLGATIGRTEFDSKIGFNGDLLSETTGEAWQAYALAKYTNKNYFVDFAVGGGTGSFKGERDTHIDPAFFIPGETLDGTYLPEEELPGIGSSVTYTQKTAMFGGSARLGFTQEMGAFYVQPTVQFDARWLRVSGTEEGSVAAFNFDGSANTYYSATPALEIGADIPISDLASVRIYGKAGAEFSNKEWEIEGRFAAAENLPGNPALHLTEAVDSPLYRVGAGIELNGVNGVGLSVRYNGAFGETVKQNAVSASLKVSF
ncbi:autotransporter outer membrane beta-barrel domain-containing protein [Mesorhizobium loti]|uniref:autotransporter outer membrane beta-barrel domain-containing protein n=1 Tax=Rhizobium loti TaxID=381 RepID=UPI0024781DF6|nr:autotransporter outer membrane beta-barrel domain-containing protein [Mesorhizobium loti]